MNTDRFRTRIPISKYPVPITHGDGILALGSCFADTIGTKLKQFHFNALVNPFGPLYNPISIISALERISNGERYVKEEVFEQNGLYHSYDHYSSFSHPSFRETLELINTALLKAHAQLNETGYLLMTFGTAWVYRLKETGTIVANCHKLPSRQFVRELLTVQDIVEAYNRFLLHFFSRKAAPKVLVTVSPVRHLRDNPHENQISKSILFAALHELESQFEGLQYFPAYEIMMDELRDYRFYADDMVHPTQIAVDYIFERFSETCISNRSRKFIEQYQEIIRARMHKVSFPGSPAAQRFGSGMCRKLKSLQDAYPEILLQDDEDYFRSLC